MIERFVIRMRRSLTDPVPEPVWPSGIRLVTFDPERHAEKIHALLVEAYARGGGYVEPFAIWWPSLQDDSDYDPALVFVAADRQDGIVGVAQCWTSAFVKDLAVAPSMRRQGLGAALLHHAFRVFRERGAAGIELKVHSDNPSGALRLYRSLGFEAIESYKLI
jgi:ribosomal protein S18 acetylase RimI-like enzyme